MKKSKSKGSPAMQSAPVSAQTSAMYSSQANQSSSSVHISSKDQNRVRTISTKVFPMMTAFVRCWSVVETATTADLRITGK
jgi:hypothetical protein